MEKYLNSLKIQDSEIGEKMGVVSIQWKVKLRERRIF